MTWNLCHWSGNFTPAMFTNTGHPHCLYSELVSGCHRLVNRPSCWRLGPLWLSHLIEVQKARAYPSITNLSITNLSKYSALIITTHTQTLASSVIFLVKFLEFHQVTHS